MNALFGSLAFLNPWALAALLVLPALYFLLRITPPTPKTIRFPAVHFLMGLKPKQNTPDHTPWWILLLRLCVAALLLLALARPVLNPAQSISDQDSLLLVVDNGWGAAQNWDVVQDTGAHLLKQAARQDQELYIITTAPEPNGKAPTLAGPLPEGQALSTLRGFSPYPWEADLKALPETLRDFSGPIIYLSDGLEKRGVSDFIEAHKDALEIYTPGMQDLALLLQPPKSLQALPSIAVDAASNIQRTQPIRVQALSARGQVLDEIALEPSQSKFPLQASFDLPAELKSQIASFQIVGGKGAQARFLLDSTNGRKSVGIVSPEDSAQNQQLTEDGFYLHKALEPYADILQGALPDILDHDPAMIILPDISGIPPHVLNTLDEWVRKGGLLLRFAGPNMTQGYTEDPLTPVPLRYEARNVEGSLSWDKPLHVKPLAPESPLYGLALDEDIEVRGQILPAVSDELQTKTWVQLDDGTPLITAAPLDSGLLVMVHTTASPLWSNLPLSGFYVQMLKRVLQFSGQTAAVASPQSGLLQPDRIFDGFGNLKPPTADVKPIDAQNFETTPISPEHPPGLYTSSGLQFAFNFGGRVDMPKAIDPSGTSLSLRVYGQTFETDLVPYLLTLAFILLLLDALIMLFISRAFLLLSGARNFKKPLLVFAVSLIGLQSTALAQTPVTKAADDLYLAYIRTGNAAIDATTQKGLEVLSAALNARTSAEPQGVMAVNPETDTLAFFPLLYWSVTPEQAPPNAQALKNLQHYIDHGGTILIDTRGAGDNPQNLQRLIGNLNIPPLSRMPDNHVLSRSFYLLERFPGRYENGAIWLESQNDSDRDGVSSIIIGGNDWAGGWADLSVIQRGDRYFITGLTPRHETSIRFGINLVMYALTGNYKTDQVHVNQILERLGKKR